MLENNHHRIFASILGRRVGNQSNNIKLTQQIIKKHGGAYDSSTYTKSKKYLTLIKSNL